MTHLEYHDKFFPDDSGWKLAYRTCAISQLEDVFGCPRRPSSDALEELKIVKVLTYYVLLGLDTSKVWHELAISREKDLIALWRDVHYGSVVAKTEKL